MYPDERRVEHTFIEIEVNNKAVRFVSNDSIHKRIPNTIRTPLIAQNVVIPLNRHDGDALCLACHAVIGMRVLSGAGAGVWGRVYVCSARFVRGPQQL